MKKRHLATTQISNILFFEQLNKDEKEILEEKKLCLKENLLPDNTILNYSLFEIRNCLKEGKNKDNLNELQRMLLTNLEFAEGLLTSLKVDELKEHTTEELKDLSGLDGKTFCNYVRNGEKGDISKYKK